MQLTLWRKRDTFFTIHHHPEEQMNVKALVAEFIGTFTLVFVGIGSIATGVGLLGVAWAHGLAFAVMVSATAAVSGGHLNPAVTLGAWIGKKIQTLPAILYVVAQCLGAIAGAWALGQFVPTEAHQSFRLGTPMLGPNTTPVAGMFLEALLTFFLVFVVYGTGFDARGPKVGGLFMGLTVVIGIIIGGPLTGAAMNPARHLGPALLTGTFENMWVYWAGPLLGGLVAGLVYHYVIEKQ
jgi:aquaporin Z